MAYIGGMYRVWVRDSNGDLVKVIDYIKTEVEAREVANSEWVKRYSKSVKVTRNEFDHKGRRKSRTIAEATKR